jgi:hypothetical protein
MDTHDVHDSHDGNAHGGGHGDDTSDVPTIVPTTWRQLIFPILILLLVVILVFGPVTNAFQSRPVPLSTTGESHGTTDGGATNVNPTAVPGSAEPTKTSNSVVDTPGVATTPTASSPVSLITPTPQFDVSATKTAVAVAGTQGEVARAPVRLDFGGTSFVVKAGNTLLPDWRPPQDQGIATWIEGSVANHILYLPYSDANAALFSSAKKGDKTKLLMNTGQVFEFEVTRSERAYNGPVAGAGQFTVTAAMAQDHAGVTLFLIGDSAQDRAVVQADFTGNIQ